MSSIGPNHGVGPHPGASQAGASSGAGSRASASAPEPGRAEQVLAKLAEKAREYPPESIAVLSASASKLLITDLGPAKALAQQIRQHASSHAGALVQTVSSDRQSEALNVLMA